MARLCSPQDCLFFSWDVQLRTFAATCCYRRLNVIERVDTHASLAFFSRRTNTSSVLHALRAYVLFRCLFKSTHSVEIALCDGYHFMKVEQLNALK